MNIGRWKILKYLPPDITAKTLNGIYERESCVTTTVTLYAKKLFSLFCNAKEAASLILMDFCWKRDRLNKSDVLKCESFFREKEKDDLIGDRHGYKRQTKEELSHNQHGSQT